MNKSLRFVVLKEKLDANNFQLSKMNKVVRVVILHLNVLILTSMTKLLFLN